MADHQIDFGKLTADALEDKLRLGDNELASLAPYSRLQRECPGLMRLFDVFGTRVAAGVWLHPWPRLLARSPSETFISIHDRTQFPQYAP